METSKTVAQRLHLASMDPKLMPYTTGALEPWSASVVCALAWSIDARDILELGAFEGLTTVALSKALPEACITAIEHDANRAGVAKKRIAFELCENVDVVQNDAIKFLRACIEIGLTFDFAFVDDDHTFAHVAEEVDLLKRVIRPGGMIVMHDVIGAFDLDEIVKYHGGRIIELPLLHAAGGLGVIRV